MLSIVKAGMRSSTMIKAKHIPVRTYIVTGPPRNRVSFAEKSVLASLIVVSICAPALWIIAHIQDYKKRD